MAWRFVTHACGHQERVNVDGSYVVVEQRVRNAERVSCPACIGIASRQRNRLTGSANCEHKNDAATMLAQDIEL